MSTFPIKKKEACKFTSEDYYFVLNTIYLAHMLKG